jgi:hypothetical protein
VPYPTLKPSKSDLLCVGAEPLEFVQPGIIVQEVVDEDWLGRENGRRNRAEPKVRLNLFHAHDCGFVDCDAVCERSGCKEEVRRGLERNFMRL